MLALGNYEDAGDFDAASPEIHSALTAAKVFRDNSKAFVNLSLYEQRLSRARKPAIISENIGFVNSDTEYDPGAFDPIYFKNPVPAPNWPQIQDKDAA
jgi:hypothetical protein